MGLSIHTTGEGKKMWKTVYIMSAFDFNTFVVIVVGIIIALVLLIKGILNIILKRDYFISIVFLDWYDFCVVFSVRISYAYLLSFKRSFYLHFLSCKLPDSYTLTCCAASFCCRISRCNNTDLSLLLLL